MDGESYHQLIHMISSSCKNGSDMVYLVAFSNEDAILVVMIRSDDLSAGDVSNLRFWVHWVVQRRLQKFFWVVPLMVGHRWRWWEYRQSHMLAWRLAVVYGVPFGEILCTFFSSNKISPLFKNYQPAHEIHSPPIQRTPPSVWLCPRSWNKSPHRTIKSPLI